MIIHRYPIAVFNDTRAVVYRLIVQREGKRVRLLTKNGHDWTDRYPLIVESALRNRSSSFVIDGEAVLLGVDGVSDFDGLHSGKFNDEVQLYAFDALVADGKDLRKLPLSLRKTNLDRLLARRPDGIFIAPFEQGEIGPDLFRKACEFGLEGLVSKHRERAYRPGTSPNWVKVKNPKHPAMKRVKEALENKSPTRLSAGPWCQVLNQRFYGVGRGWGGGVACASNENQAFCIHQRASRLRHPRRHRNSRWPRIRKFELADQKYCRFRSIWRAAVFRG